VPLAVRPRLTRRAKGLEKEHHRTGKIVRNGCFVHLKARDLLDHRAKKAAQEWLSTVKLSKEDRKLMKAR
jgi:hypothetical protein